jgi:hypothetical protein
MTEVTKVRRLKAGDEVEAAAGCFTPFVIARVEKVWLDGQGSHWVQTEGGEMMPERKLRMARI